MKRSLAVNARKFRRTSNSQKAYVNKQKDIARRKILLSDRIELHLVLMKDLQVSSTCIDKENSPIGLIPSDVVVLCTHYPPYKTNDPDLWNCKAGNEH